MNNYSHYEPKKVYLAVDLGAASGEYLREYLMVSGLNYMKSIASIMCL